MEVKDMNEHKKNVIEKLREMNIDAIKLEKELLLMLRKMKSSMEVRDYLKKIIEGERK